ncbi:MAG: rod-binding protein [Micavibrio sp.]
MKLDMTSPLSNPALLAQGKAAPDIDMQRIEDTAREFEAVFMAEMMKPLFESIKVDGRFGGGKGEEIFRSFLRDEYGKIISRTESIGIADQVREQLIEMQSRAAEPELAQNMHSQTMYGAAKAATGEDNDVL